MKAKRPVKSKEARLSPAEKARALAAMLRGQKSRYTSGDRLRVAAALGHPDLRSYFQSPEWAAVQAAAVAAAPECQVCKRREADSASATDLTVAALTGADKAKLLTTCKWCRF